MVTALVLDPIKTFSLWFGSFVDSNKMMSTQVQITKT
jgi:hypothetical protein